MKITTEDLGERQVLLTLEVDEARVEKALRGAARRIAKEYNIPGFRRGRAPYNVILRRFGREALLQDALEDLGEEVIGEALKSEELVPFGPGELEDIQLDPLVLKLRVPLLPMIDLGDYRELRVEPPAVTVEEEEVDAELERLRQANDMLEPAGDRPAELGDVVILDVEGDMGDEPYYDEESSDVLLDAEDEPFAPGFTGQIVGLKAGEEKSFTLALPDDEDLEEEERGQEIAFSVTLREVMSRILPDLDDDLARTVGDFDTLDELRQSIHDRLEGAAQLRADQAYVDQALDALVANASIEYPPDLLEEQIDNDIADLERRLENQGLELDDFYKLSGQTEQAFRDSARPRAVQTVERSLVLSDLARQENLDVDEDEVNQRIALMSASWGERAGEIQELLSAPSGVRSITNDLMVDKAVQRLVAIAKGEAPPLEQVEAEEKEAGDEALLEELDVQGQEVATESPEATAQVEEAVTEQEATSEVEQVEN